PRFVLAYESELRQALLAPEHADGFTATRLLGALDYVHEYECVLRCPPPCSCEQPPPVSAAAAAARDPVADAAAKVAAVAGRIRARVKLIRDADVYRDHAADGTHDPPAGICALARDIFGSHPDDEWTSAIDEWRRWLFREVHLKRHATGFWSEAVRYLDENDD